MTRRKKIRRARLPLRALYALMKWRMEEDLANLKLRTPWQHAGVRAQHLLDTSPIYWRIYRAAIAAGEPSEFQRPGTRRTERDEKWEPLEQAARALVARSERPLTLRNAVAAIVRTPEGEAMYRAYLKARDR
jgi:hypothetical protein